MAATAQDSQAPLRGPEKKDEDKEDESECMAQLAQGPSVCACATCMSIVVGGNAADRCGTGLRCCCCCCWAQPSSRPSTASTRERCCRRRGASTTHRLTPAGVSRCVLRLRAAAAVQLLARKRSKRVCHGVAAAAAVGQRWSPALSGLGWHAEHGVGRNRCGSRRNCCGRTLRAGDHQAALPPQPGRDVHQGAEWGEVCNTGRGVARGHAPR